VSDVKDCILEECAGFIAANQTESKFVGSQVLSFCLCQNSGIQTRE
jgi:hypothetical protein